MATFRNKAYVRLMAAQSNSTDVDLDDDADSSEVGQSDNVPAESVPPDLSPPALSPQLEPHPRLRSSFQHSPPPLSPQDSSPSHPPQPQSSTKQHPSSISQSQRQKTNDAEKEVREQQVPQQQQLLQDRQEREKLLSQKIKRKIFQRIRLIYQQIRQTLGSALEDPTPQQAEQLYESLEKHSVQHLQYLYEIVKKLTPEELRQLGQKPQTSQQSAHEERNQSLPSENLQKISPQQLQPETSQQPAHQQPNQSSSSQNLQNIPTQIQESSHQIQNQPSLEIQQQSPLSPNTQHLQSEHLIPQPSQQLERSPLAQLQRGPSPIYIQEPVNLDESQQISSLYSKLLSNATSQRQPQRYVEQLLHQNDPCEESTQCFNPMARLHLGYKFMQHSLEDHLLQHLPANQKLPWMELYGVPEHQQQFHEQLWKQRAPHIFAAQASREQLMDELRLQRDIQQRFFLFIKARGIPQTLVQRDVCKQAYRQKILLDALEQIENRPDNHQLCGTASCNGAVSQLQGQQRRLEGASFQEFQEMLCEDLQHLFFRQLQELISQQIQQSSSNEVSELLSQQLRDRSAQELKEIVSQQLHNTVSQALQGEGLHLSAQQTEDIYLYVQRLSSQQYHDVSSRELQEFVLISHGAQPSFQQPQNSSSAQEIQGSSSQETHELKKSPQKRVCLSRQRNSQPSSDKSATKISNSHKNASEKNSQDSLQTQPKRSPQKRRKKTPKKSIVEPTAEVSTKDSL